MVPIGSSGTNEFAPVCRRREEKIALPSQVEFGNGLQRQLSASSSSIYSRVRCTERRQLVLDALTAVKEACDLDLISEIEKKLLKAQMCKGFHLSVFYLLSRLFLYVF